MKHDDSDLYDYCCGWCGNRFKAYAKKYEAGQGKHSNISTQIVCPNCGNFIETWK